jgi:hypothetical protein
MSGMSHGPAPRSSRWRRWFLHSPVARRIGLAVAMLEGLGVLVAIVLLVTVVVEGRVLPGLGLLTLPTALLVAIGIAWAASWLVLWQAAEAVTPRRGWTFIRGALTGGRESATGSWAVRVQRVLGLIFVGGWIAGFASFPSTSAGVPTTGDVGCPYRLDDHGAYSCVSAERYGEVEAAEQRRTLGWALGVLTFGLGVALGGVTEQRGVASLLPPIAPRADAVE